MNIERIFQNYQPRPMGYENEYSIVVLVTKIKGENHIIFEKRSKYISHPGDVSLPGGKVEVGEKPLAAAKREASEELGVDISDIDIVGEMDYLHDLRNGIIRVYIGRIENFKPKEFIKNKEVEFVFTYPISYFMSNKPEIYKYSLKNKFEEDFPFDLIPNGKDYSFKELDNDVYFYKGTSPMIWGLTAKVIAKFIDICEGEIDE